MTKELVENLWVDESCIDSFDQTKYHSFQVIHFYCTHPNCNKEQTIRNSKFNKVLLCRYHKTQQTCKQKYGGIGNASSVLRKKQKDTMIEKYGVECSFQFESVRNNNANWVKSDEFKQKSKNTLMLKYGVDNSAKVSAFQDKAINTKLEKYGQLRASTKIKMFGIAFDSMWEVYVYYYLKKHNVNFTYHPRTFFTYLKNGKEHKYFPDFYVNGEYWEVKGDNFFLDGKPYDTIRQEPWVEKYNCAVEHNVKFLIGKDIEPYKKFYLETIQ